jgi:hypothetical protein
LHEVAVSTDRVAMRVAELSGALLADQRDARAREANRFRVMYVALGLVLFLLAVVVVQGRIEAVARDDRASVTQAQRVCSDVVTTDVLGRLSILAVQPRFRVRADGTPVRDEAGRLVPLSTDELLAQTETLRRDVDRSNHILTRISEVCYGPDGPDPTPLDGDPTR